MDSYIIVAEVTEEVNDYTNLDLTIDAIEQNASEVSEADSIETKYVFDSGMTKDPV